VVNTRSGSTIGTTANARFAKAKVNDVMGLILFPDTYTHPDGVTAPTGVNATGETGWNGNNYTAADWTKMESAGCVFLPAAGGRYNQSNPTLVVNAGTEGNYWSSTSDNSTANLLTFSGYSFNPSITDSPRMGYSVRLVKSAPTYSITLAEGTEDEGNWNVPAKAAEGATVTVTYNGDRKVKSVKAVKKEVIKPDLLSGVFSVSASKKVNFSKGNLQATYDGSSWTWAFANNQWDYIGNSAGNTKVTDASPFISENGTVDLFGWVGASSTWDGVNQYGITSSKTRNATNGYGNSATENLKNDWGTLMGTGWRTLTKDEWAYMLNSRSGTSYCKAQVNSKSGLVIFPDGYTHPTGPTAPTNTNTTNVAYTTNSWSGEAWTKMENAGCVFLPAAGSRDGNSVSNAGTAGTYWWSTHYEGGGDAVDRAYNLYFTNNYLLPTAGSYRNMGCSVRLVQEVAAQ
jgi:hypothetical protein